MTSVVAVCDNCGSEVGPEEGARLEARARSGGGLIKTGILCDRCVGYLPGAESGAPSASAAKTARAFDDNARSPALAERHRRALGWFAEMAGREVGWPRPLDDGTLLVCRPKGIYKPAWSKYALSVRESLARPYPDEQPLYRPDGTWAYRYYQENLDPEGRDREFTNAALIACRDDAVPVGVLRQVAAKPRSRYVVLGIARVGEWRDGYFELESAEVAIATASGATTTRTGSEIRDLLSKLVGKELRTASGRANTILGIEGDAIRVATARTPEGALVPIEWIVTAVERLRSEGEIDVSVASVGYRSAFVGAVLLQLPGAALAGEAPPRIRLT